MFSACGCAHACVGLFLRYCVARGAEWLHFIYVYCGHPGTDSTVSSIISGPDPKQSATYDRVAICLLYVDVVLVCGCAWVVRAPNTRCMAHELLSEFS